MLTLDLFEDYNKEPLFIQALRDFLPVALKVLDLDHIPKIVLKKELHNTNVPTFGRFTNEDKVVYCVINNRHPNDILRTLAHELAHYGQGQEHELSSGSWHTGSPVENDAHVKAGIIMRHFNTEFPKYLKAAPIVLPDHKIEEEWSKKYKKSINCNNPKGFSQKAHCAGRKKHTNEAEDSCPPATQDITLNLKNRQKAINEYGYGPLNPDLPNTKFWMKKVDEWNLDSPEEAKSSLCGNCAAFDQRKATLDCIAQGIGSDQGADDPTIDAGDLGYCRFLKFKCASRRTCDAWVTGGPLVDKSQVTENLRDWFGKEKWVRMDTKGNIQGPCARGSAKEGKPKCLPQAKAHALGKKGRAAAAQKKRREDPDPNRRGPAKNVATKVNEQSTRRDPQDLTAPTDQQLDKLHHKFIPAWSMLDHDLLATAYDFQDDDTALSYVNQLHDVEQSMDHNAVITVDNARVSVKVRTGDIDGLSRLDFEFALRANDLADEFGADQLAHATNAINEQQFDENCWKGYHKEGNKKMFGKTVPNCVKNESQDDLDEDGRIARKPGQPANSKKHSDLYTDENPKGTITGLKFATVEDAKASVGKIRNSGRSHAHKIQAAVAMEQRARAAGKSSAAAVYRSYINSVKKPNESLEYYVTEGICPECQGLMVAESQVNEKQDACYHKVKSRYKVWPSAYASGALVQCRKKGAANWGNKGKS
jgi:pterin-4a-carbinolamine dehydratase